MNENEDMSPNLAMNIKQIKQLKLQLQQLIMKKKERIVTLKTPKSNRANKKKHQPSNQRSRNYFPSKTPPAKTKNVKQNKPDQKKQIKQKLIEIIERQSPYFIKDSSIRKQQQISKEKNIDIIQEQKIEQPPPLIKLKKTDSVINQITVPQPVQQFRIFRPSDLKKQNLENRQKQIQDRQNITKIQKDSLPKGNFDLKKKQALVRQNKMKASKGFSQSVQRDQSSDFLYNREKSKTTDHKLYFTDQFAQQKKKKREEIKEKIDQKAKSYELLDMRLNKLKILSQQQFKDKKKRQEQIAAVTMYKKLSPLAKFLRIKKEVSIGKNNDNFVPKNQKMIYSFIF